MLAVSTLAVLCSTAAASAELMYTSLAHPLAGQGGTIASDVEGNRIIGNYFDASGASHAFVYDGTTWTTLDHPSAALPRGTAAFGISNGVICGTYVNAAGRTLGFLYDGITWTTLARPPLGAGPVDTFARGISGDTVVGYSIESLLARGFSYDGVTFSDLIVPGAVGTFPDDIDSGRIVGTYEDLLGSHGFISTGGVPITLDHPLGTPLGTSLTGVDGSDIVGNYIRLPDATSHGFLFDGSGFTPVDFPGATDTTVNGIGGAQVVGSYRDDSGAIRGFVATIPEPAGALMIALGLYPVARRRRTVGVSPPNCPIWS